MARESIDLTIVGPEDPLAAGIVDAFEEAGLRIFGPTAAAARLESDKSFAKTLMRQQAVPTADARIFDNYDQARQYIATRDEPVVIKAAGLAKGKGVIVCEDPADGILAAERMMVNRIFGDAGARIIVEERLNGREASLLAIVDGQTIFVLEPAQDYKRLGAGDTRPNTGGMGSFSPTSVLDDELLAEIQRQILVPTLDGLTREGIHYCGVLYAGLMLTPAGQVLDSTAASATRRQAILMRLQSDLLELLDAAVSGHLEDAAVRWDPRHALCVVMASQGYPDKYRTGLPITGLPEDALRDDLAIFHAGTRIQDGQVVTSGGRVLGVTALGGSLSDARRVAYEAVGRIHFEGAYFRPDLGQE